MFNLHAFEIFVLQQFKNKNWYYKDIIVYFQSNYCSFESIDFAIYNLRMKGLLNTYYDYLGRQYFTLNTVSVDYLKALEPKTTTTIIKEKVIFHTEFKYIQPTSKDLESIQLIKNQDLTISTKTKKITLFEIISTFLTIIGLILGYLQLT